MCDFRLRVSSFGNNGQFPVASVQHYLTVSTWIISAKRHSEVRGRALSWIFLLSNSKKILRGQSKMTDRCRFATAAAVAAAAPHPPPLPRDGASQGPCAGTRCRPGSPAGRRRMRGCHQLGYIDFSTNPLRRMGMD